MKFFTHDIWAGWHGDSAPCHRTRYPRFQSFALRNVIFLSLICFSLAPLFSSAQQKNVESPEMRMNRINLAGKEISNSDWNFVLREVRQGRGTNFVSLLTEFACDPRSRRRKESQYQLGKMGAAAKEAVPKLIQTLEMAKGEMWSDIAEVLGEIGPDSRLAVPLLMAELKNENSNYRNVAASALGGIGKPAQEAVPLLSALERGKDGRLAFYCLNALVRILDPPGEYLQKLMKEADSPLERNTSHAVTMEAMETFTKLGPAAAVTLPFVVKRLDDPDSSEKLSAIKALEAIGPKARPAVAKLSKILDRKSEEMDVRIAAAEAIGKIEDKTSEMQKRIAEIKIEEAKKEEQRWLNINSKVKAKYSRHMNLLPAVDRAEIYALDLDEPTSEKDSFMLHAGARKYKVIGSKTVLTNEAEAIASMWRDLDFGMEFEALCHDPGYALKFYRGSKLLMEATVCWGCSNFETQFAMIGFNARSATGQALLKKLDSIVPYKRSEEREKK